MINDNSNDNIGKKIRLCREKAGLSRLQFQEKFGVSQRTLKAYENGENILTGTKVTLFNNIFKSIGLDLIQENITKDKSIKISNIESAEFKFDDNDINIKYEIDFFKEKNKNYLLYTISNNYMYPIFNIGDIIGGIKIMDNSSFSKFLGAICIIVDSANDKFIGRLLKLYEESAFISPYNNEDAIKNPIVEIKNVQSIAQVTRHWCLNNLIRI